MTVCLFLKMLVCRTLPLIDPGVRYKVLAYMIDIFPVWGYPEMEKAFPYLRHCILHAEIRDLLTVISAVRDNKVYDTLAASKVNQQLNSQIF